MVRATAICCAATEQCRLQQHPQYDRQQQYDRQHSCAQWGRERAERCRTGDTEYAPAPFSLGRWGWRRRGWCRLGRHGPGGFVATKCRQETGACAASGPSGTADWSTNPTSGSARWSARTTTGTAVDVQSNFARGGSDASSCRPGLGYQGTNGKSAYSNADGWRSVGNRATPYKQTASWADQGPIACANTNGAGCCASVAPVASRIRAETVADGCSVASVLAVGPTRADRAAG